jgi:hypothetical protein
MLGLCEELGLKVKKLKKRGEVLLIFQSKNGSSFTLRLSQRKAQLLCFWLYNKIKEEVRYDS